MLILVTALILKLSLVLGFEASSKSNVAVYWGQASAGSQESLASNCQSPDVDIVLLSFLYSFPTSIDLDFSSACSSSFGDGLLHCDQIAQDIKTCQSQGKKVLLSMGGAIGSYGFTSDSQAEDFATTLWDTFAGGSASERPFNDAVVDGFDFDIENQNPTGYAALAKKLREHFNSASRDYYLSAAPQCFYPDASVGDLLNNAEIDFAFIQFYNNYCNVDSHFNWDTWTQFAAGAPNPNIKLYLGLPGSSSAAGSGYLSDLNLVQSTVNKISGSANFGGIMLWDASQSFTNKVDGDTYAAQMKKILGSVSSESTPNTFSQTPSSTSSSASSTVASSTFFAKSSAATSRFVTSASSATDLSSATVAPSSTSQFFAKSAKSSLFVASTSSSPDVTFTSEASTTLSPQSSSMASSAPVSHAHTQALTSSVPVVIYSTSTASQSASAASLQTTSLETSATSSSAESQPSNTMTASATSAASSSETSFTLSSTSQQSRTVLAPTSIPTFAPSTTSSPTATGSNTWAHTRAIELNAQYAAGQLNGKSSCSDGEIACSADGHITICDHGLWVYTECAAGTTCFAYDYEDAVYSSCNFANVKSSFV
ncbi:LAFA_0E15852g1_1 [Lachancea sp. 'fantastica']|nr:LAFA_0E15852g1_1 [Lachancea sp. 'fantastica']